MSFQSKINHTTTLYLLAYGEMPREINVKWLDVTHTFVLDFGKSNGWVGDTINEVFGNLEDDLFAKIQSKIQNKNK